MKSVDDVSKTWVKRQKYLFLRIFVITLLASFGLDGLYNTSNISNTLIQNTLVLFSLPLFLEYYKGMDSYSKYTSSIRWIGLILNFLILAICVVGYFGKMTLTYYDDFMLKQLILYGVIKIHVGLVVTSTLLMIPLSILDLVFTFNKRELYFLNAVEELDDFIKEKYKDFAKQSTPQDRKEHFKKHILTQINTHVKTEGGMR